jgi:ATP-dependent helicase/nuclease subunit A
MGAGTLTIYSASAGSGKTFALAEAYLEKLFRSRFSYRKILAVTFTNKATAEMKDRILEELDRLSEGRESKYLPRLISSSGKSEEVIRREAREILYSVLHDYSRFSVSTIDSFFQKIIRSFARETGLKAGFDIEIDPSLILDAAIDKMIAGAAADKTLKRWLSDFAEARIEEGKNWDLKQNIRGLTNELFREKFRLLSVDEKDKLENKEFLTSYIREMRKISSGFSDKMKEIGMICLSFFDRLGLSDEMFYYKGNGVPGYIRAITEGRMIIPNSYVKAIRNDPPKWCSGSMHPSIVQAIKEGFEDSVKEALVYHERNYTAYRSANAILSNIYALGILSDILTQVRIILKNENIFLLPDAGELIYQITRNDQAPFIYEKVGNNFENYMIDEFQDTSKIQWNNFQYLVENSMSEGFDNLIVGDIKQSIYRWRNSDWQTLDRLRKKVDNERYIEKHLGTNWRSADNIIRFNNTLFTILPQILDKELSGCVPSANIRSLFSDAHQELSAENGRKRDKGYVRIEFIDNADGERWDEQVLKKLPAIIESVEDKGYLASDIGILVRDNHEGAMVLKELIDYSISCPEEKKNSYNLSVVSNDSLLLENSPVITFIIAVLKVLDNPEDMISRALMLRFFLMATGNRNSEEVLLFNDSLAEISSGYFPEGHTEFLNGIRDLPLWDITEKVIQFFGLGKLSFNVAYLNCFQDLILDFTARGTAGVPSFLEWWESEGHKKSIQLPGEQDSIQVLTIHKAKGLEFDVVILPFLSWNLDHKPFHNNILWTKPEAPPFNNLGIVPVRYSSELENTIFASDYQQEKYSAYIDNINLLYVALTRAKYAIFGFAPLSPAANNRIAVVLKEALTEEVTYTCRPEIRPDKYFDKEKSIFEYGIIPHGPREKKEPDSRRISGYIVNENPGSLKLKLHWENYFDAAGSEARRRINYGKLMHDIFSEIITPDDVTAAVRKKVLEGILPEDEEAGITERIKSLISQPEVSTWFEKANEVMTEASILMPKSGTRRPDRIIISKGVAIIVDFKFGEEDPHHHAQIGHYRKILLEMGYPKVDAYLWYVDSDKIVAG